MERIILKNKPLIEAIFELRWDLQEPHEGMTIDPHYKILIGRIYDRIKNEYPFHEQLPTATMPDEIAGYLIQHRFRKEKDSWPLIQIGPGIVTLNDTEGYVWEDYKERIIILLQALFEAYPDSETNFMPNWLSLRYIDAIDFNFERKSIFTFLKQQMKVSLKIDENFFKNTNVINTPLSFDLRFTFPADKPKGSLNLRFFRGKRKNKDALIWETQFQVNKENVPQSKEQIIAWIEDAHTLTDDWFFKMIEGKLLRSFV